MTHSIISKNEFFPSFHIAFTIHFSIFQRYVSNQTLDEDQNNSIAPKIQTLYIFPAKRLKSKLKPKSDKYFCHSE